MGEMRLYAEERGPLHELAMEILSALGEDEPNAMKNALSGERMSGITTLLRVHATATEGTRTTLANLKLQLGIELYATRAFEKNPAFPDNNTTELLNRALRILDLMSEPNGEHAKIVADHVFHQLQPEKTKEEYAKHDAGRLEELQTTRMRERNLMKGVVSDDRWKNSGNSVLFKKSIQYALDALLIHAATYGNVELMKKLYKEGANPNAVINDWTALKSAVVGAEYEAAKFLLPKMTLKAIETVDECWRNDRLGTPKQVKMTAEKYAKPNLSSEMPGSDGMAKLIDERIWDLRNEQIETRSKSRSASSRMKPHVSRAPGGAGSQVAKKPTLVA